MYLKGAGCAGYTLADAGYTLQTQGGFFGLFFGLFGLFGLWPIKGHAGLSSAAQKSAEKAAPRPFWAKWRFLSEIAKKSVTRPFFG